ncbi:8-oxo-dGTP diphosphatase [Luteibacter sp. Sphag1AF]|uniref:Nudix family hydrolase n=1 Tax=Luteibacter sp. Sphag1AF TaxID=2587031 RepID=UPI0016152944|nr:Nudix family hydrolase [Luteibacter sp. Sphag1AF]MBB3225436.1 8-oxo-dGTP diphosphatase [Luteibacter sp. Sphag1AF]
MHVVAGLLVDDPGRLLLAQRPPGKHLAGMWEMPGGKLEPGESALQALARELDEELGIHLDAGSVEPLIRIPWTYGDRSLFLEAMIVRRWRGEPQALDAAAIAWHLPWDIDAGILAPADRPMLNALRLPTSYAITPAELSVAQARGWILAALDRGGRLLQLRLPDVAVSEVRELAADMQPLVRACGAQLLLNGDIEGARALGPGVGVHLRSAQLESLSARPLPYGQLVGASCHDAQELVAAVRTGADFATLSPVHPTRSHPGAPALGWQRFEALAEAAPMPVYALGGMRVEWIDEARRFGAQGVAGIGAFVTT